MSIRASQLLLMPRATTVAFAAGALLLALDPLFWLIGTWYQQGYDGTGWLAAALTLGLAAWSFASPRSAQTRGASPETSATLLLLALTAAIRLAAQLLDVNVLGALLLGVDIYALGRLAGLQQRERAVSPFWLAALFCFSLPIEPMLQRVFGFALQQISAYLACGMLMPVYRNLTCSGVRLQVDGHDVLVDLPCSGAELISLVTMIFTLINVLRRPTPAAAAISAVACVILALLGNGLRIALLAVGISLDGALPFRVMDPLPHAVVGLAVVSLTSLALVTISLRLPVAAVHQAPSRRAAIVETDSVAPVASRAQEGWFRFLYSVFFLAFALLVGALQPRPVDASPLVSSPVIPRFAAGFSAEEISLDDRERGYFQRYGGAARRARFGPFGLLLVTTGSPLRHLHDPAICLTGLGFAVRLVGTDHSTGSTVYVAERPGEGDAAEPERYTLRVSYMSDDGRLASSIAEVVWRWLEQPEAHWTMVQRITPHHPDVDADTARLWEAAMRRAFNLS